MGRLFQASGARFEAGICVIARAVCKLSGPGEAADSSVASGAAAWEKITGVLLADGSG